MGNEFLAPKNNYILNIKLKGGKNLQNWRNILLKSCWQIFAPLHIVYFYFSLVNSTLELNTLQVPRDRLCQNTIRCLRRRIRLQ